MSLHYNHLANYLLTASMYAYLGCVSALFDLICGTTSTAAAAATTTTTETTWIERDRGVVCKSNLSVLQPETVKSNK